MSYMGRTSEDYPPPWDRSIRAKILYDLLMLREGADNAVRPSYKTMYMDRLEALERMIREYFRNEDAAFKSLETKDADR